MQLYKPECLVRELDCCIQGQGHSKDSKCQWMFFQPISRSKWRVKMSVDVFLDNVFSITELFMTNLDKLWHDHELEWHVKRLVCCLHGLGHSEGAYGRITTFHYFFWTTDSLATTLGMLVHHQRQNVFWKDCIAVFKGKGSEFQCLSWWCFLNCLTFCNQTW